MNRVSGRVYARPSPARVVLLVGIEARTYPCSPSLSTPAGALVQLHLDADGVARACELVALAQRDPFAPGAETRRFALDAVAGHLRTRSAIARALRDHLDGEGFVEVDTPAVVPNPGNDPHLASYPVGPVGWLSTSPEYHLKRLVTGGVSQCYQFARCWRADELGARHQPEFTMLEFYRAWAPLDAVLHDTEALVVTAFCAAGGDGRRLTRGGREIALDRPFARLTVREAFARWAPEVGDPVTLAARDEALYYEVFSSRVEPMLGRERATFLTGFASVQASLARVDPGCPETCLRAELYIDGVELCNAFDELTDPVEQRARFAADNVTRAALGRPVYPLDTAFLSALDEAMPPSAGNALGFDRLVMLATGAPSLDAVIAFPRR